LLRKQSLFTFGEKRFYHHQLVRSSRNRKGAASVLILKFLCKLGFKNEKIPLKKAISEEIRGDFENSAIEDAIYCIMPANADAHEKQIAATLP
jgi:hypothetical protein